MVGIQHGDCRHLEFIKSDAVHEFTDSDQFSPNLVGTLRLWLITHPWHKNATYPDFGECSHRFHKIAGPRKCRCSLRNIVAIFYRKLDESTSAIEASLDSPFPVTSLSTGGKRSYSRVHWLMCRKCLCSNKMYLVGYSKQYRAGSNNSPIIVNH